MKYTHFGGFVESLDENNGRIALSYRPFIKVERLTYQQLQSRAYQVAQYLQDRGVRPGERIMIIGPNSPDWVSLFLGAQLIGVSVVPVDIRSNLEAAHKYAAQTAPKLIFKSDYTLPDLGTKYPTCSLEKLSESLEDQPDTPPDVKLTGDETALIVFTSGTTAEPKGVILTQHNVLANVEGVNQALTIDPDWRLLSVLPLSHMFEMIGCLVVLSAGASTCYIPRVTPRSIVRALNDYQITTILAVPQLLTVFLERIRQTAAQEGKLKTLETALKVAPYLPFPVRRKLFASVHKGLGGHLDMVVAGGAPTPTEVSAAWEYMGVRVVQGYGLTETSPILAVNDPNNRRIDSQGMPLKNLQLRINKADGEIQAKGPNVFQGYWQNDTATKEAFTEDHWFKTGDIGRLENGWLKIQGRAKFTIVLASGLKVFPEDVELVADKVPAWSAICVVGVKHQSGEIVKAVISSDKPDAEIEQAIAAVNDELQSFQRITAWVRWPEHDFPRTRLLKVDRKRVQTWANQESTEKVATAPAEHAESQDPLLQCIRLSIDKPTLTMHSSDRLADLGLDSLRRLNLISLIEEQFNVVVSESSITQTTTIAQLRNLVKTSEPVHAADTTPPRWQYSRYVRVFGNLLRDTLVRGIIRIWVRQHTEGLDRLAHIDGPAFFICNHVDNFDAPVTYFALPRKIRNRLAVAQADDFMREHKGVALLSRLCFSGYNFARKAPFMPSLEQTAKLVDEGWNILLYPEGTISENGKLQPFKSGVGLLAVELGIPVVPVKTKDLYGTVPLHASCPKKRSHVTVTVGEPVAFKPGTSYDQATEQLAATMREL